MAIEEPMVLDGEPYTVHEDPAECCHFGFDVCGQCGGLDESESARLAAYLRSHNATGGEL